MSRIVIAGAGVTGLLAAVECARGGHRVIVVDRGTIPNPASGSFDQHRVLRALHPADALRTRDGVRARRRWRELERLLGARLYRRVGVVTSWPEDRVVAVLDTAHRANVAVRFHDPNSVPHIVVPDGHVVMREPEAGVLLADRVLRAATEWLRAHPAVTLRSGREVVGVDIDRARLTLAGGEILGGDLVLIATGAWSSTLVDRPIALHRQTMMYLRPPADTRSWWERAPSAGRIGAGGQAWLLPPGAGTLLKISSDTVCREVREVDISDDSWWAARLLAEPILTDQHRYTIAAVKHCHYTVDARTGGGALDRIGPAVWARAATGGDGFRTAPLIADRIAEVASADLAAGPPLEKEHR